jgi:hypothetical protein
MLINLYLILIDAQLIREKYAELKNLSSFVEKTRY